MPAAASLISTDPVPPRERAGFWAECIGRLFPGLGCDVYGDTEVEGRASTVMAGDVRLTRLEATRHHVTWSKQALRSSERGHLKIVAPWVGCAGVQQKGRETWVTPDQWSIYDTTESYAVANPARVEHLIVMLPKDQLAARGLGAGSLDALMARRLGGSGGVARLALETMRSAWRELPGMSDTAARGVGDAITQFVHLALLDLEGVGTALTQREALRERIKRHVRQHLGDPSLTVDGIALALGCSRRQLYNAFGDEPDGVAGYLLRQRLLACRNAFDDRGNAHRSITDIAFAFGFTNMAHFSRVFRSHLGVAPSDYRRMGQNGGE